MPGFHKEFADYATATQGHGVGRPPVCLGDFAPLRMQEDRAVIARYQHISCEAGSVIFFDWRLPHANSYRHCGTRPREVIYTGFLPDTALNRVYVKEQLRRYQARLVPVDHWQKDDVDARVREDYSLHSFSPLGSRLMGLAPW